MNSLSNTELRSSSHYKMLLFSVLYVLQLSFYAANYWSLGLLFSWKTVLSIAFLAAPILGYMWLTVLSFIFQISGKWLGGAADRSQLSPLIIDSSKPLFFFLPFWALFIALNPKGVFVLAGGAPSPLLITGLWLALTFWSQLLCTHAIRKVQEFSFWRATANVFISWIIYSVIFFFLFLIFRFFFKFNYN